VQDAVGQNETRLTGQTGVEATYRAARARQKWRDVRNPKREEDQRRHKRAPERGNKVEVAVEGIIGRGEAQKEIGTAVVANEARGRKEDQLRETRMNVEV
jgi:hypothetical protein